MHCRSFLCKQMQLDRGAHRCGWVTTADVQDRPLCQQFHAVWQQSQCTGEAADGQSIEAITYLLHCILPVHSDDLQVHPEMSGIWPETAPVAAPWDMHASDKLSFRTHTQKASIPLSVYIQHCSDRGATHVFQNCETMLCDDSVVLPPEPGADRVSERSRMQKVRTELRVCLRLGEVPYGWLCGGHLVLFDWTTSGDFRNAPCATSHNVLKNQSA